jgi:LPXTG-motif cell wall-anchored protein
MPNFSVASRWRRLVRLASLLTAALVSAAVVATPSPAIAAPTTDSADAAAGYLAGQLVDGNHLESVFGNDSFPDAGLTIDGIFAFAAAGVAGDSAQAAIGWLGSQSVLSGYIGDGNDESYVGATAKTALLAEVIGQDPATFHGIDLITRLLALLDTQSGQFKDKSTFGEFTTTFSQSYAILALSGAPGGAPAKAVHFLAGTQCSDGGFPVPYTGTCASDPDGTALAVQALLAAGDTQTAGEAIAWLVKNQQPGGGFGAGTGNANSTGLAAQALRVGGEDAASDRAIAFLKALQIGCDGLPANRGGIAFNQVDPADPSSGFQTSTAPRATAQAILGLTGVGFADLSLAGISADAPTLDCPVAAAAAAAPLANTGASVTSVVLLAAGLVVAGVALVFLARVRRRTAA